MRDIDSSHSPFAIERFEHPKYSALRQIFYGTVSVILARLYQGLLVPFDGFLSNDQP